jgi:hypothetical protein
MSVVGRRTTDQADSVAGERGGWPSGYDRAVQDGYEVREEEARMIGHGELAVATVGQAL